MEWLDIGEVTKQTGLKPSALRYYESRGLIRAVGRKGLRRQYHPKVIQQLSLISLGRMGGLTLEEISEMFTDDGHLDIDRAVLLNKANALEQTIRQLTKIQLGLRHVAECPEENHLQCPSFQKMLKDVNHAEDPSFLK